MRRLRAILVPLGAVLAAASTGCQSAFDLHRADVRALADAGRYQDVAQLLDETPYADRDHLLWLLDRGAAACFLGDTDDAVALLNEAEAVMDWRRRRDLGDLVAMTVLNDSAARYLGAPYEDMYVNVLKMLAHLQAGRIVGGATVEARRMAIKTTLLRQEYLRMERAVEDRSAGLGAAAAPPEVVARSEGGRFIDSPLGTFLTAMIFMHSGESANQSVAARRLRQAIEAQRELIGPVDEEAFAELEHLAPADASVLIVALSGRGPVKEAFPVGPIYLPYVPVYFELPVLHVPASRVEGVRAIVESDAGASDVALHLVERLGQVAQANHEAELPLIYTRTLLRAAAKSYGLYEANRAVARSTDGDPVAVLATAAASLLLLGATEKADLRCWALLPGQAHVGWMGLPPGRHRVTLEYVDAYGSVIYRSPLREVDVGEEGLASVVDEYWE